MLNFSKIAMVICVAVLTSACQTTQSLPNLMPPAGQVAAQHVIEVPPPAGLNQLAEIDDIDVYALEIQQDKHFVGGVCASTAIDSPIPYVASRIISEELEADLEIGTAAGSNPSVVIRVEELKLEARLSGFNFVFIELTYTVTTPEGEVYIGGALGADGNIRPDAECEERMELLVQAYAKAAEHALNDVATQLNDARRVAY